MADDSLLSGAETGKDYKEMLSVCRETIDSASNDRMKVITAEAALNLICTQRDEMKENGIAENDILEVVTLAEKTGDPEIADLAKETREGLQRTYHPKKEG